MSFQTHSIVRFVEGSWIIDLLVHHLIIKLCSVLLLLPLSPNHLIFLSASLLLLDSPLILGPSVTLGDLYLMLLLQPLLVVEATILLLHQHLIVLGQLPQLLFP
jgi:hypothetical protein